MFNIVIYKNHNLASINFNADQKQLFLQNLTIHLAGDNLHLPQLILHQLFGILHVLSLFRNEEI